MPNLNKCNSASSLSEFEISTKKAKADDKPKNTNRILKSLNLSKKIDEIRQISTESHKISNEKV